MNRKIRRKKKILVGLIIYIWAIQNIIAAIEICLGWIVRVRFIVCLDNILVRMLVFNDNRISVLIVKCNFDRSNSSQFNPFRTVRDLFDLKDKNGFVFFTRYSLRRHPLVYLTRSMFISVHMWYIFEVYFIDFIRHLLFGSLLIRWLSVQRPRIYLFTFDLHWVHLSRPQKILPPSIPYNVKTILKYIRLRSP